MLRSPSLSLLLATLLCAASSLRCLIAQEVVTQSPAERCAAALLRGDVEAAADAATSATDPAERARLQAAVLPLSQRPLAMLSVAARHRDSREADLAILAGAAAIAVQRDHGRSLPELRGWNDFEDGDDRGEELAPSPVVVGLWRELAHRRAHGGDLQLLAEAERLLQEVSVSRFGFEPARVEPAAQWALPERREDLLLRAWRRQPGCSSWAEFAGLGRADHEQLLPLDRREPAAGLPAGDWLLELSSTATYWRALRAVEVSDVDVVAIYDRERIALGVWRGGRAAEAGRWWLRGGDGEVGSGDVLTGALPGGTALLTEPDAVRSLAAGGELFVEVDGQRARVPFSASQWWQADERHDRWQAHLMVDRPLYRPGETILGRLVLRETSADGDGIDAVLTSRPAVDREVELCALEEGEQVKLRGRTDAHGVFGFELPLAPWAATGAVPIVVRLLGEGLGVGDERVVYSGRPCTVASFRRAACTLDVQGPSRVIAGSDAEVAVVAHWASGAPARGLAVVADVRQWGSRARDESWRLVTGEDGRAVLALPLQRTGASHVRVTFQVDTPDGRKELVRYVAVESPPAATDPEQVATRASRQLQLLPPRLAVVGQPCALRVRGAAGGRALLAIGRGSRMRLEQLRFDDAGEAVVVVTPLRAEWPALDLRVADGSRSDSERVPLLLQSPVAPQVELPQRCAPGSTIGCRVATGVAGAIVTAAVVDERVFAIAEDRTADPATALRPRAPRDAWHSAASVVPMSGQELLDSLLVDGRVPPSGYGGSLRTGGPAGGGAAGPTDRENELRSRFRATAAFVTVVADADGTAVLPIALPDDLTTWRVTLLGATPDGATFVERRALVTRLPLAAEPVLPRVLREGDVVQTPVVVDRAAETVVDGAVHLTVGSADAALRIENGAQQLAVAPGQAAATMVTLRAVSAGVAGLDLGVEAGALADRSQRAVPVMPDAVVRPLSAAAMGAGEVALALPEGLAVGTPMTVSVLGGSSAAWAAIERRLQVYPYGCVEQTLSKLLPFAAAARGAAAHGATPPAVDKEFELRLRSGFARLRQLQHGRGGAFSFWPDESIDRAMTALVMHGLAVLRAGGVEPGRYGIECDPAKAPFADAIAALGARAGRCDGVEQLLELELAAACLRLVPSHAAARDAVRAALGVEQALPAGLLARCGLALAAAGDADAGERCWRRLRDGERVGGGDTSLPGERPLAVRALQLELQATLHPDAIAADAVGAVLLGCLDGYSSTYEQGAALVALALAIPRREPGEFAVQLRVGEQDRELQLTAAAGFVAELRVGAAARLAVRGPAGQMLVLRVHGQRLEAGAAHAAWSAPLVVERALCRRRPGTGNSLPRGDVLVPVGADALRCGEPLWLRLRVSAPRALRYVVVECPLPAGFELGAEPTAIERFDDRFVWSCGFVSSHVRELVVPIVPTLVGTMAWPPTTAAPMYADGSDGGTAGAWVTVSPAVPDGARPSRVACWRGWDPTTRGARPAATARERFDEAIAAADHALSDDDAMALEAAWASVVVEDAALRQERQAAGDHDDLGHVLYDLTALLETMRDDEFAGDQLVRREVFAALVTLQTRVLHETLTQFERAPSEYLDDYHAEVLVDALVCQADREARETLLARVLGLALARGVWPGDELADVVGPVEDEELRAVLLAAVASRAGPTLAQVADLLSTADLEALPVIGLAAADADDWPEGHVRRLLLDELGRAELRRVLGDPTLVAEHATELLDGLPERWWRDASLAVFHELDGYRDDGVDVVAWLAASRVPDAALQRELLTTPDGSWQGTLALALRRRAVRELGDVPADAAAPADPERDAWLATVALRDDDGAAAAAVLQQLREAEQWPDPRLVELLTDIVFGSGAIELLAPMAVHLEEAACAQLLTRLDPAQRRQLLASVGFSLEALPRAADDDDGEALWSYGQRLDQLDEVVEALCESDAGLAFLDRRIASIEDEALREHVRKNRCQACGFDPETGEPWPDEPWLPLLHAVARGSAVTTWSVAERQRYDRMRLLRGVR